MHRLSTKICLTYVLLVVVLETSVVYYFSWYNKTKLYEESVNNLIQLVDSTMQQVDNRLTSMEDVAVNVLTTPGFVDSLSEAFAEEDNPQRESVRKTLNESYLNVNDIRRVTVFDYEGNYISTGKTDVSNAEVKKRTENLLQDYQSDLINTRVFLGKHQDNWGNNDSYVISEIKCIKNRELQIVGFIEIQQNIFYLEKECNVLWNNIPLDTIIYMGSNKEIFYSNMVSTNYSEDMLNQIESMQDKYNQINRYGHYIIGMSSSNYYESKLMFILDERILLSTYRTFLIGLIAVAAAILVFSIVFVIGAVHLIMRPFELLVKRMKNADLSNLAEHHSYKNMDIETQTLLTAYEDMAKRILNNIELQKHMQEVQTKTLFSVLQSEISPHFLYNTMGSIANMCEEGDGENAAEACFNLSDLLRYSSDYATSDVTVEEEIANLNCYLELMKSRYRQRLEYRINADESAADYQLPKLTLQPLVENAIKYGLIENETVNITVSVKVDNHQLRIEVRDNGAGITEDAKQVIKERVDSFISNIETEVIISKIQIGGMGLSSTLIRLSIYFGKRFHYEFITNNEYGGTTVLLYVDGEEKDV